MINPSAEGAHALECKKTPEPPTSAKINKKFEIILREKTEINHPRLKNRKNPTQCLDTRAVHELTESDTALSLRQSNGSLRFSRRWQTRNNEETEKEHPR